MRGNVGNVPLFKTTVAREYEVFDALPKRFRDFLNASNRNYSACEVRNLIDRLGEDQAFSMVTEYDKQFAR